jgi:hypothetical protein
VEGDGADGGRQARSQQPVRERLVRWDELLATCLASAIAAIVLSRLGVAGTVVGAALTPFIMTVGSAALAREIARARERLRATSVGLRGMSWDRSALRVPRGRRLASALVTGGVAFLITVGVITLMEAVAGKPLDRWGREGRSGYTFGDSRSSGSSEPGRPESSGPTGTSLTDPSSTSPAPTVPRTSPGDTVTVTVTTTVAAPTVTSQTSTGPSAVPPSATGTTTTVAP